MDKEAETRVPNDIGFLNFGHAWEKPAPGMQVDPAHVLITKDGNLVPARLYHNKQPLPITPIPNP